MIKYLFILISILFFNVVKSQGTMCYSQMTVPYITDPYVGTPLILGDDVHSAAVNIGFPFCYNGSIYSQCVISSNNYITFNLTNANTYSPWSTVFVPSVIPLQISNSILNPWQDIHPGLGGSITYQTLGVAPNRRFVVSYLNIPMFSCTTQRYSSQTVLYEGSNCIGSYILEKNICAIWNGGNAVHALLNNGGTSAVIVPGRNNTQWAETGGLIFIPTCLPCSTSIQCAIPLPIELIRFDGHNDNDVNILEWSTATEQNTDVFVVERSKDGDNFIPISVVDAAGTSTETLNYQVIDHQPIIGINYYRLRNLDLDGTSGLSEIISIRYISENILHLYPNPSKGVINYQLSYNVNKPILLEMRDVSGRIVKSLSITNSTGLIDISSISPGIYNISIPGSKENRFIVE